MRRDEDMRESPTQACFQLAQTLAVKWDEAGSWFQPELLSLPEAKLREWLQQADLKVYDHYFDDLLRTASTSCPPARRNCWRWPARRPRQRATPSDC